MKTIYTFRSRNAVSLTSMYEIRRATNDV